MNPELPRLIAFVPHGVATAILLPVMTTVWREGFFVDKFSVKRKILFSAVISFWILNSFFFFYHGLRLNWAVSKTVADLILILRGFTSIIASASIYYLYSDRD